MAKATAIPVKIEKEPMYETKQVVVGYKTTTIPGGVMLELTEDEAATLLDIMNAIGGDSCKTRRMHADRVAIALRGAGVTPMPNRWLHTSDKNDLVGSLYFK